MKNRTKLVLSAIGYVAGYVITKKATDLWMSIVLDWLEEQFKDR